MESVLFVRSGPAFADPRVEKEAGSLAKRGYQVEVLAWDRRREHPRYEARQGYVIHRVHFRAPYASPTLVIFVPIWWVLEFWYIRRKKPDIVHSCDFDTVVPPLFMRVLGLHNFKLVYDMFDAYADRAFGIPRVVRRIIWFFDRIAAEKVDALILVDESRREQLKGCKLCRVEIVMNTPPDLGIAQDQKRERPFRIYLSGTIQEQRGIKQLARVLPSLPDIEVIVAGVMPRPRDFDVLKHQKHVRYLGKVSYEDSLRIMRDCDVVFALYDPKIPINVYASPNKLFEAMMMAKPVISNIETKISAIIEREACGILIPYENTQALREAIMRLKEVPPLGRSLGENGRRAFEREYNWKVMENRLFRLYDDLAGVQTEHDFVEPTPRDSHPVVLR